MLMRICVYYGRKMRLIYKSYAITTYGKSSMSISDPSGKEIFHTNTFVYSGEDDLKMYLKDFVKEKRWENLKKTT